MKFNKRKKQARALHDQLRKAKRNQNAAGYEVEMEANPLLDTSIIDPSLIGANAVLLPGQKGESGPQIVKEKEPEEPRLSKSQMRKLRQVEEHKRKREERAGLVSQLGEHGIAEDELKMLIPVSQRGQKETKKQKLRRALLLERAGLPVPAELGLYRTRKAPQQEEDEESEEEDEEENRARPSPSESEDEGDEATAAARPIPVVAAASKQKGKGKGINVGRWSDEEEEEEEEEGGMVEGSSSEEEGDAAGEESEEEELVKGGKAREVQAAGDSVRNMVRRLRHEAGVADDERDIGPQPLDMAPKPKSRTILALGEERRDSGGRAGTSGRGTAPEVSLTDELRRTRIIPVSRPPEIEAQRESLPVVHMEQEIMEAIASHDVVVLCGETGSGKTTQVPQFLYEAGYGCKEYPERAGIIGCTQPRRVAAVSTSKRVAQELGTVAGAPGSHVGYQVRYDRATTDSTRIKFMTDGILLRELQDDFLLRRYSVVLVDEAHERSMNTDLLLGMLSRVLPLRRRLYESKQSPGGQPVYPLKLVIMSATLRVADFTENTRLFPSPPPVIHVSARQFPVTVHFAKKTELKDYEAAAYRKVLRIHRELPPGGILVFLTGQREVEAMCKKLRAAFPAPGEGRRKGKAGAGREAGKGPGRAASALEEEERAAGDETVEGAEDLVGLWGEDGAERPGVGDKREAEEEEGDDEMFEGNDDFSDLEVDEEEDETLVLGGEGLTQDQIKEMDRIWEQKYAKEIGLKPNGGAPASTLPGGDAGGNVFAAAAAPLPGATEEETRGPGPLHVLPLYAMLAPNLQERVFRPPPEGSRLVVVATNVAETSLTIPGIRYVVDAGRSKQKVLDERSGGMTKFEVRWVSKASADQRAGRSGRTGPGHCYRLYSSALFNDTFPQFSPPEILSTPLEGVSLVLRALGIDKVENFPFPTPPERPALVAATQALKSIAAVDPDTGLLTPMGRAMACYPISPRHSRMLLHCLVEATSSGSGGLGVSAGAGGTKSAAQSLPYAIALAAALSVESPFLHIDSIRGDEGQEDNEGAIRRKKDQARGRHAGFRCDRSDALSALRVLADYQAQGESESFARSNFLIAKNLREMSELHKQLRRILTSLKPDRVRAGLRGKDLEAAGPLLRAMERMAQGEFGHLGTLTTRPTEAVETRLRRALAAGWADHVARRVKSAEFVAQLQARAEEEGKKLKAVRYTSCSLEGQEVYLHPSSALGKTAPSFVVYLEVVQTEKRPYMAVVTEVEAAWLTECCPALCSVSKALLDPPPSYRPEIDQVVTWHEVAYGKFLWELPACMRPCTSEADRTAAFASALLEGKVLPALQDLRKAFVASPALLTRPEAQAHKRVSDLLAALRKAGVDSRASLSRVLASKATFLRAEVAQWLQKGTDPALLDRCWRRVVAEAGAGPGAGGGGGAAAALLAAAGPVRPPAAAAMDHVDLGAAPVSLSNVARGGGRGLKRPAEKAAGGPGGHVVTFKQRRG